MIASLSEYRSQLQETDIGWVHPEDKSLLEHEAHSFNLDYPPPAFVGNIVAARVIVLAANGGYDQSRTSQEFAIPGSSQIYLERLANPAAANWAGIAPYYQGINYVDLLFGGTAAIVNACAYRSKKISEETDNKKLIKRLPSVRFNRRWLIEVVLPAANQGERLIVGKRYGHWDLPPAITASPGYIADPAPVSPHLSRVVSRLISSRWPATRMS